MSRSQCNLWSQRRRKFLIKTFSKHQQILVNAKKPYFDEQGDSQVRWIRGAQVALYPALRRDGAEIATAGLGGARLEHRHNTSQSQNALEDHRRRAPAQPRLEASTILVKLLLLKKQYPTCDLKAARFGRKIVLTKVTLFTETACFS